MRRTITLCLAGAVTLGGAAAAHAEPAPTGPVYQAPFSDQLFQATVEDGETVLHDVDYETWSILGFPAPQVLPTRYYSTSFGPALSAVVDYPGTSLDGEPHVLTYAEWAKAGFPKPENGDRVVVQYLKYATSSELFAGLPTGQAVKLDYAKWSALGFPQPQNLPVSFTKLSWSPAIMVATTEFAGTITLEEWKDAGFPTPQTVQRYPGDRFYFATRNTDVVMYQGPTYSGPVTFAQWDAAGFPAVEAYAPATAVAFTTAAGKPANLLPTVAGTGEPGADLVFTVGEDEVGSTVVDEEGGFEAELDLTGRFGEQVTVTATQSFAGKDDEVDTLDLDLALGLTITSPAAGATDVPRTVTVTGTGEPGSTVTLTWGNHPNDEHPDLVAAPGVAEDGTWSVEVDLSEAPVGTWLNANASGFPQAQVAVSLVVVETPEVVDMVHIDGGGNARSLRPLITGFGEPGATVQLEAVFDGETTPVGTALVGDNGSWSTQADLTGYSGQVISLFAVQTVNGMTTRDGVDGLSLVLTYQITSPTEGATAARQQLVVRGTGQPGTWAHFHLETAGGEHRVGTGGLVESDGTWSVDVTEWLGAEDSAMRVVLYDDNSHTPLGQIVNFTVVAPS